ncbi:SDR family NAD(P)-dependent oxidoreductase [Coxiella burnetii]|uniref:SDR family NAD(P)-dependent oxidoreductase n=1 Tax=Coxiella burnetii TaxID=777 RepID=UPI0003A9C10D|nr:SDR family oxidoreductase [Coxiella burnetii]
MLLKDKVVIVTGSTTGIGAAITTACVAQGAKVMIHGRDESRAREMVQKLGKEKSAYYLSQLSDEGIQSSLGLVEATLDHFGRVDSLINNAAKSPRNDIDSVTVEEFDWIVRLNLRSPLFLTQAVVKAFRKQGGGGTVVNIGSINAYCGEAVLLVYSMTKGALMTMTRSLGNALGKEGIRVNQLNVGWTLTENESKIKESQGFPENWESKIPPTYAPSGRLIHPEDVARHAVFWASDVSAPANAVVYELEQYPVIGRNLINEIPLDIFK